MAGQAVLLTDKVSLQELARAMFDTAVEEDVTQRKTEGSDDGELMDWGNGVVRVFYHALAVDLFRRIEARRK